MYIFPFLVEGGTEGICTCTEEHEIKYDGDDEHKQISPFAQGKVVICMTKKQKWANMLNANNPLSLS